jgi:lysophospholipase L1-like esterase
MTANGEHASAEKKPYEEPFTSNAIRMSGKELIALAAVFAALMALIPAAWNKAETVKTEDNFRIAYDYRDDYWVYDKWATRAASEFPAVFLGDSVVWGMYVDNESALPAVLNKRLGKMSVANLAIDGLHSVALDGLVANYCGALRGKKVLLHYNPLWMNSQQYDLSGEEETSPHHPRLLPQFSPGLKCYGAEFSERMSVTLDRRIPFVRMLNHLRLCFFQNKDFKQWIVDNPGENPLGRISLTIDAGQKEKINSTRDWVASGIPPQDWKWVSLQDSKQWSYFQSVVARLQAADNQLCVMVGPINPHMQTAASLAQFREFQQEIKAWLDARGIESVVVPDLPSELYADASHPLKEGYELIADELLKTKLVSSLAMASSH